MFQNLEIRNFRLFDHLKVERLGQINLVGGGNNSGKTTLLEALFLLCGTADPQLVLSINALRGLNNLVTPTTAIRETLLKPLFYQFASNQTIGHFEKSPFPHPKEPAGPCKPSSLLTFSW